MLRPYMILLEWLGAMKKRKKKKLDVGQVARRRARESGIAPSSTRVIEDKRKRAPKHKKPLGADDSV